MTRSKIQKTARREGWAPTRPPVLLALSLALFPEWSVAL